MFLEDLCVEYSKTNRATCRKCKGKIQFDELRIGEELLVDEDEKPVVFWTHLSCFNIGRKYRDIDATLIKGYTELSSEHQRMTKMHFDAGGIRNRSQILPQTKQKKKQLRILRKDQHNQENKKQEGQHHHECENGESEDDTGNTHSQENQQLNKDNQTVQLQNKQHKSTEKARRNALVLLGYSYPQFEKYLNIVDSLKHTSEDQLRKMLELNSQSILGRKDTLVHRCADGMLLGAIPKCPVCKKQNMDFNFTDGFFKCLGKELGTCGKKYDSDLITRTPWINEDV